MEDSEARFVEENDEHVESRGPENELEVSAQDGRVPFQGVDERNRLQGDGRKGIAVLSSVVVHEPE